MNKAENNEQAVIGGDMKYGGLIKRSYYKVFRNDLFYLFSYLDSVVPFCFSLHDVISFWRIFQFIGPCFCAAYNSLWDRNSTEGKVISILSILFHIIPVENRKNSTVVFEFLFAIINILIFCIVIVSTLYYKKTAKLPGKLSNFIYIYIHTFGYLLHPIALNIVGENLGRLFNGQTKQNSTLEIVSIILSVLCFFIWITFFTRIVVVSFRFRPNSLISVLSNSQNLIIITTCVVTFFTAMASQLSQIPSIICTFITSILYLVGILSLFIPGSFVHSYHEYLIFTSSTTSCAFSLVMTIYLIYEHKCSFI